MIHNYYLENKRKQLQNMQKKLEIHKKQEKQIKEAVFRAEAKENTSVLDALKLKANALSNKVVLEKIEIKKIEREINKFS